MFKQQIHFEILYNRLVFDCKQKNKKILNQKQESETKREEIIYHNLYFPYNKVHCDNCEKDITKQARILCVGCPNSIDICMNCFLNLHEFASHNIGHSYSIINKLNFPIFVDDWTAEEELLLLEGLEKKGFGNWQDIAEMLGNEKSQEEICQHYDDIILSQKFRNMTLLSKRNQDIVRVIKITFFFYSLIINLLQNIKDNIIAIIMKYQYQLTKINYMKSIYKQYKIK